MIEKVIHDQLDKISDGLQFGSILLRFYRGKVVRYVRTDDVSGDLDKTEKEIEDP
jgi:hypothetical protein